MRVNSKNIIENIISDFTEFAAIQKEYWKLNAIEKLSLIVSFIIIVFICLSAFFFAFAYLSVALVFVFEEMLGDFAPALFIVSGINLLIIVLIILFRKALFFSPMARLISKLMK
ncbi:MAG: hypothetical protein LBR52_04310 [Prevotellaceae bacterium]|jgi:hypothetical protein|nr:hypothetical protein [Prevotellaceae bacterium]